MKHHSVSCDPLVLFSCIHTQLYQCLVFVRDKLGGGVVKLLENCYFSPKDWLLTWDWSFAICDVPPVFHKGLQVCFADHMICCGLLCPEIVLDWFLCFIWDVCGGLWNALNRATC